MRVVVALMCLLAGCTAGDADPADGGPNGDAGVTDGGSPDAGSSCSQPGEVAALIFQQNIDEFALADHTVPWREIVVGSESDTLDFEPLRGLQFIAGDVRLQGQVEALNFDAFAEAAQVTGLIDILGTVPPELELPRVTRLCSLLIGANQGELRTLRLPALVELGEATANSQTELCAIDLGSIAAPPSGLCDASRDFDLCTAGTLVISPPCE